MAARGRSYRGRVPAVSWPGTGRIVGASAPCRGVCACACSCARCAPHAMPSASASYRRRPQRRIVDAVPRASVVSQAQGRAPGRPCPGLAVLYCNTAQPFLLGPITIQFVCIEIQVSSPALQPIAIQYTVLRYSSPAAPNLYVTIHLGFTIQPFPNLLQYNPSLHKPQSQYKILYCNTNSHHISCNTIARLAIQIHNTIRQ